MNRGAYITATLRRIPDNHMQREIAELREHLINAFGSAKTAV